MGKDCKYDIALSFAEEELAVAEQIAAALKAKSVSYYLYTEHTAENLGKKLMQISQQVYGIDTKHVLMLTSEKFVKKYWTSIESQIVQVAADGKPDFIFRVKLDETRVDGVPDTNVSLKWNNNADEIADIIKNKLALKQGKQTLQKRWLSKVLASIVLTMTVLGFVMWYSMGRSNDDKLNSETTGSFAQKKPDTNGSTTIKDNVQPGTGSLPDTMSASLKGVQPVSFTAIKENRLRQGEVVVQQPFIKDTEEQFDYCIIVTGSNSAFNNMVANGVKSYLLSKKRLITENQYKARNIIRVILSAEEPSSKSEYGTISSFCIYDFSIVNSNEKILASGSDRLGEPGFSEQGNLNNLSKRVIKKINEFL